MTERVSDDKMSNGATRERAERAGDEMLSAKKKFSNDNPTFGHFDNKKDKNGNDTNSINFIKQDKQNTKKSMQIHWKSVYF